MILQRNYSSLPKSKAADEAYERWKKSKSQKDAEEFMNIWTREVYLPARQKGIMVDPDPEIVDAAAGHVEHPEWAKKKEQKAFGTTADKATKDKPVAREIGTIVGSAGVGLGAGAMVYGAAKNSNKIGKAAREKIESGLEKKTEKYLKKLDKRYEKEIAETPTKKIGLAIEKVAVLDRADRVKKKIVEKGRKLKRITDPVSKFAETKKGKAALIGVPTAVIGGMVYRSAKKKDKKDKK